MGNKAVQCGNVVVDKAAFHKRGWKRFQKVWYVLVVQVTAGQEKIHQSGAHTMLPSGSVKEVQQSSFGEGFQVKFLEI